MYDPRQERDGSLNLNIWNNDDARRNLKKKDNAKSSPNANANANASKDKEGKANNGKRNASVPVGDYTIEILATALNGATSTSTFVFTVEA